MRGAAKVARHQTIRQPFNADLPDFGPAAERTSVKEASFFAATLQCTLLNLFSHAVSSTVRPTASLAYSVFIRPM